MAKKGYTTERERILQLEEQGWYCLRCSGSIGECDICVMRKDIVYELYHVRLEQIKKTRKKKFYFDDQSKSELNRLKAISLEKGIPCFFSIKFTNRNWKIINVLDMDGSPVMNPPLKGRACK